jgi:Bax protein
MHHSLKTAGALALLTLMGEAWSYPGGHWPYPSPYAAAWGRPSAWPVVYPRPAQRVSGAEAAGGDESASRSPVSAAPAGAEPHPRPVPTDVTGAGPAETGLAPTSAAEHTTRDSAASVPERPRTEPSAADAASGAPRGVDDGKTLARSLPDALTGGRLDTAAHKALFIGTVLPLARLENQRLAGERRRLIELLARMEANEGLDAQERAWLADRLRRCRVEGDPRQDPAVRAALREKLDTLPVELVLAQAANESAWGRSRFAKEGNNLFGVWTYDPEEGIVPRRREAGKTHLVKRYPDLRASVRDYLRNLNSHPAYAELRALRAAAQDRGERADGLTLAAGLTEYSARGADYVAAIRSLIRVNDLEVHARALHAEVLALRP